MLITWVPVTALVAFVVVTVIAWVPVAPQVKLMVSLRPPVFVVENCPVACQR